jgi:phytoene desaturase
MAKQSVVIIGGGFGGLAVACLLGKKGYDVTVLEKNEQMGGRASVFKAEGFTFDMGPSWYLMPDVFEKFFTSLDEDINEYLALNRLDPSYRIFFKDVYDQPFDIASDIKKDSAIFEQIEPGSSKKLKEYLDRSEYVYKTAIDKFLYRNYDSVKDFISPSLAKEATKLALFSNMDRYVRKFFKSTELQKIMQYPLVFLGSSPFNAPAIYSLMSHVDFNQGVFYPDGGFGSVVKALESIAQKHNVKLETNANVSKIITKKGTAIGVTVNGGDVYADIVISDADPFFTEQKLLQPKERDHSDKYWKSRTLAPSALLMYLGVKGELPQLTHHNLIFSKDWKKNFGQIFDDPQWPDDPSLYISNPSKSDGSVAPKGHENLFVLVPIPSGLKYSQKQLEAYANKILKTISQETKIPDLWDRIVYKRLFCVDDFASRYNSMNGTGLGLAHTLKQTAVFRPKNVSKKVKNLYYVGANVHPGIGVPTTLISAELLIRRLHNK